MEKRKCPQCSLVNWSTEINCKRCDFSFAGNNESRSQNDFARENPTTTSATNKTKNERIPRRDVNREGWKKIKTGAIISGVFAAVIISIILSGYRIKWISPFALVTGLTPTAWLLAGVFEITTGVPFTEMSQKWDSLAGWQRGVIGISVFVGGLFLLGIVSVLFVIGLDYL